MSPTEVTLLAVYRTPIIRLERICQEYFGVSYDTARKLAAFNQLPVPAYRMGDSMKAPFEPPVRLVADAPERTA